MTLASERQIPLVQILCQLIGSLFLVSADGRNGNQVLQQHHGIVGVVLGFHILLIFRFRNNHGENHGEYEYAKDDGKREGGGHLVVPENFEQHLQTHKAQDDTQTIL